MHNIDIYPRQILIEFLKKNLPVNQKDAVLLKVYSQGEKNIKEVNLIYNLIDYYNEKEKLIAMMRTTVFPIKKEVNLV